MPEDAERAYTAYAEHQHWQTFRGAAMPVWVDLPEDLKRAWTAAVTAVREAPDPVSTP